jgi:hypothetical protein
MMYLDSDPTGSENKLAGAGARSRYSTAPKTPSKLVDTVKQVPPSDMLVYDRQKLLEFLSERETSLFKTRDEYEEQFESFCLLAKRFHVERLKNLKLTFKNQILKQQIYFETELLELSKVCTTSLFWVGSFQ